MTNFHYQALGWVSWVAEAKELTRQEFTVSLGRQDRPIPNDNNNRSHYQGLGYKSSVKCFACVNSLKTLQGRS